MSLSFFITFDIIWASSWAFAAQQGCQDKEEKNLENEKNVQVSESQGISVFGKFCKGGEISKLS